MSVVQFNLLPDIKLEFDKNQRAKRLVFSVSTLAVAAVAVIFLISFTTVHVVQKKLLNDADKNITSYSNQLKGINDLAKILTVQNQLNSLPNLHQNKHIASRLFSYLPQITPLNANIGKLDLDTSAGTISISGTADTVETVNKFVDTLKFTSYMLSGKNTTKKSAFSNVILSNVNRTDKDATYTIDANYDPALFDASSSVTLVVPQEITTRSVLNAPVLFNGQTDKTQSSSNSGQTQGGQ